MVAPPTGGELLLCLDPSTTRTGYAAFTATADIEDAGYFTPRRGDDVLTRIRTQCEDLESWLQARRRGRRLGPVIIESPSGHVAAWLRRKTRGAPPQGLDLYGAAFGAIWWACIDACCRVMVVPATTWTRGTSKRKRRAAIAMSYPQYRSAVQPASGRRAFVDAGGDMADAIGLGLWAFGRWSLAAHG